MQKSYTINPGDAVPFRNQTCYCIGTGRMGLALQKAYMEQLALVQSQIGFRYIRGHGLFHEDMAIYQEYQDENGETRPEYNFTYLDVVMDNYRSVGLRPFLELGFMPKKMASGTQTIFYWEGNVTPPKFYKAWENLVTATLAHLMERYGADEVTAWPIEVWNEPNLSVFWKDADMDEYFTLFHRTLLAVKKLDSRFRVGGPSICGIDDERWLRMFLEYCQQNKLPLDFVTRHHYTIEKPEFTGRYGICQLVPPGEECLRPLRVSRDIIDSFPEYKGFEMHITEFNTSYSPRTPLHDTNLNAAYIAGMLAELGDMNESYSYWTFGDIFEESGVPFTPFHGGFGLVANGLIPKPTFYTFQFFSQLTGECVHRSEDCLIARTPEGAYRGIAWHTCLSRDTESLAMHINLPAADREYCLAMKFLDESCGNPLKVWHDMGEPANPSEHQLSWLRDAARPVVQTSRHAAKDDKVEFILHLNKNAVVYFELTAAPIKSDRGYNYDSYLNG